MNYREPDLSDRVARIETKLSRLETEMRLEPIARTALFIAPGVAACVFAGCAERHVFGCTAAWVIAALGCGVVAAFQAAKVAKL